MAFLKKLLIDAGGLAILLMVGLVFWLIPAVPHAPTPTPEEKEPKMTREEITLTNGMRVIIIPDHRSPVVVHSVWYQAGSVDEQPGKTGIAHMLEHLMFKSTKNLPGKEREKIVSRNGAQENAFTSRDYTAYYQKMAKDRLGLMMKLEADRMENLQLTNDDFLPERKVVQEERRMRTDSQPVNRFYEELIAQHYAGHPYHHPVIGWGDDIAGYELADAVQWYSTHYAPNNATLILAGDITLAEAMPLIEEHYGATTPAKTPQRQAKTVPPQDGPQVFTKVDKDVQVPMWLRFYRTPTAQNATTTGNPQDAAALEIMAEILGGSETGRLYNALVKEQQIADSAYASYDVTGAAESSVDLFLRPKQDVTLAQVAAAAEKVIETFIADGVTAEELERARTGLKAEDIYAQDDVFVQAYRLGTWLMAGGSEEAFDGWLDALDAVTAADVQRMAQHYLTPEHSTTGQLVADESQL